LRHGLGNVVVMVLFIVDWYLRLSSPAAPGAAPIVLSFVAIAIALVTAWLGGELVDRLGVGVDDEANLNAPNSISHTQTPVAEDRGRTRRVA
jgi:uncharacterized membrane protein